MGDRAVPQYVAQEDSFGCLVACVAMVTGQTYAEIRKRCEPALISENPDRCGIHEGIANVLLGEFGFATIRRYRHHSPTKQDRDPWPCASFAQVHIAYVTTTMAHAVVLLADGTVLDPNNRERTTLAHFNRVSAIDGVFYVGGHCTETTLPPPSSVAYAALAEEARRLAFHMRLDPLGLGEAKGGHERDVRALCDKVDEMAAALATQDAAYRAETERLREAGASETIAAVAKWISSSTASAMFGSDSYGLRRRLSALILERRWETDLKGEEMR